MTRRQDKSWDFSEAPGAEEESHGWTFGDGGAAGSGNPETNEPYSWGSPMPPRDSTPDNPSVPDPPPEQSNPWGVPRNFDPPPPSKNPGHAPGKPGPVSGDQDEVPPQKRIAGDHPDEVIRRHHHFRRTLSSLSYVEAISYTPSHTSRGLEWFDAVEVRDLMSNVVLGQHRSYVFESPGRSLYTQERSAYYNDDSLASWRERGARLDPLRRVFDNPRLPPFFKLANILLANPLEGERIIVSGISEALSNTLPREKVAEFINAELPPLFSAISEQASTPDFLPRKIYLLLGYLKRVDLRVKCISYFSNFPEEDTEVTHVPLREPTATARVL